MHARIYLKSKSQDKVLDLANEAIDTLMCELASVNGIKITIAKPMLPLAGKHVVLATVRAIRTNGTRVRCDSYSIVWFNGASIQGAKYKTESNKQEVKQDDN